MGLDCLSTIAQRLPAITSRNSASAPAPGTIHSLSGRFAAVRAVARVAGSSAHRTSFARLLAAEQPVRERRNQLAHPPCTKPELVATAPNQTWSWDITRLLGPKRWTYFYLYVLLDIFSRYVVGWMVAERESVASASRLIEQSCLKQGIEPQVLTCLNVVDRFRASRRSSRQ